MNAIRTLMTAAAATLALALALPLGAQEDHGPGMHVEDAYARVNGGIGKTGAIFLMVHNNTETDDRLLDVSSDVAQRVELHTHKDNGNGVMQMLHVPEGFALPAGEMLYLARGGHHVMLLGLTRALQDGDTFPLTLTFEKAGEVTVDVTVDNARKPAAPENMDHDAMHKQMHGTMHGATQGG